MYFIQDNLQLLNISTCIAAVKLIISPSNCVTIPHGRAGKYCPSICPNNSSVRLSVPISARGQLIPGNG